MTLVDPAYIRLKALLVWKSKARKKKSSTSPRAGVVSRLVPEFLTQGGLGGVLCYVLMLVAVVCMRVDWTAMSKHLARYLNMR